MEQQQDEELYVKLKEGDVTAFDLLYERHKKGLFSFIYSYLKDRQESEDVFHESFMKVLKENDANFHDGSFKGWLYFVARNAALNRLRSKKRWSITQEELLRTPVEVEMEGEIINRDLHQQLKERLMGLPHELAEIVNMRLAGLSNQEIAEALHIPVGTVKSRFHSLVTLLRTELSV